MSGGPVLLRRPGRARAPLPGLVAAAAAALAATLAGAGAPEATVPGTSQPGAASAPKALRGADLAAMIGRELARHGLSGDPMIGAERLFPPCPEALTVAPSGTSGWATVRVACPTAAPGWPLLVRTRAQAGTPRRTDAAGGTGQNTLAGGAELPLAPAGSTEVVTLATSLRAGEVIDADDITLAPSSQSLSTGLFSDPAAVIGRRLLVPLGEGQALRARHLEIDWTLRAGAPVQIVNQIAGIEIVTEGRALADAQTGDLIEVENASSGQVLGAVVVSAEKVRPVAKIPPRNVVADSVRRVPWLMH